MLMCLISFTDYELCWSVFMNVTGDVYNGLYVLMLMHTFLDRYTDYELWWHVFRNAIAGAQIIFETNLLCDGGQVMSCFIRNCPRVVKIFATHFICKEDIGKWCQHRPLAPCQISNALLRDVIGSISCICNRGCWYRRGLLQEWCLILAV